MANSLPRGICFYPNFEQLLLKITRRLACAMLPIQKQFLHSLKKRLLLTILFVNNYQLLMASEAFTAQ